MFLGSGCGNRGDASHASKGTKDTAENVSGDMAEHSEESTLEESSAEETTEEAVVQTEQSRDAYPEVF